MVIKSEKNNIMIFVFCTCMLTACCIILAVSGDIWLGLGIGGFWILYLIRTWIVFGRTFIMDEEGCTVCLWKYKKKYLWKDMRVKKLEHHWVSTNVKARSYSHEDVVLFSVHPVWKPRWVYPEDHCMHNLHPFSLICVNFAFKEGSIARAETKGFGIYEVEEEIFMEKMKLWNVGLEDNWVKRNGHRYYLKK